MFIKFIERSNKGTEGLHIGLESLWHMVGWAVSRSLDNLKDSMSLQHPARL